MTVSETVFWFAVVPALIVLLVGGLAYAFGGSRRDRRYRPGRPYGAAPVWFLSAPEGQDGAATRLEPPVGHRPDELVAAPAGRPVPQGATGGASDRW